MAENTIKCPNCAAEVAAEEVATRYATDEELCWECAADINADDAHEDADWDC